MEIKVHGTFLDTMQTIQKIVENNFFENLSRELDIYSIYIDDCDVSNLIKLAYAGIQSFISAYENDELEKDLNVYMACIEHGMACSVESAINYVDNKFIDCAPFDDDFFKGRFAQEKADEYIQSITNDSDKIKQITAYFNYAQYERDMFLSAYSFIESNKTQYIFEN